MCYSLLRVCAFAACALLLANSAHADRVSASAVWNAGEPGRGAGNFDPYVASASIDSVDYPGFPFTNPHFTAGANADLYSRQLIADASASRSSGDALTGWASGTAEWHDFGLRLPPSALPAAVVNSSYLYIKAVAIVGGAGEEFENGFAAFVGHDEAAVGPGYVFALKQANTIWVASFKMPLSYLIGGSGIQLDVTAYTKSTVTGTGESSSAISTNVLFLFGDQFGNPIQGLQSIELLSGLPHDAGYLEYEVVPASPSLVATLPGDYNYDGTVDAGDYTFWRKQLGGNVALLNDDTPGVGLDDFTRWRQNFGNTLGGHDDSGELTGLTTAAVPEPSAFALLAIGIASGAVSRRERIHRCQRREE